MKKIFILFLFTNILTAQISNVVRNKDSYTQEVFPYKGVRAIQIDEVSSVGNEDNVFIFSKIEKNAIPDKMYFQRFTKTNGKWVVKSILEVNHNGIISAWGSRKAFWDCNKDKSIDGLFIYGLYDADFKQQSVHLIFSQKDQFYTIESSLSDDFKTDKFSDNFKSLDAESKKQVLEYWNKLDKKDK
ncbi:hypothetical protein [Flavobacterium reichenbachii]|uniref:Uncharacterized protein n=1 Tax=Flavobacterium reichenbachii TaxID=362418 RepID=A0A085ZRC2_9FLAO|nr:hypothetical protein [Flavobacterium reichenbachii]KFF06986.1 hypothetical protein IW19_16355 [Flavobacterium reichenbachii]OXB12040.1 hypothetical protein B0A68_20145 [Flavobacterium reichenbachii]